MPQVSWNMRMWVNLCLFIRCKRVPFSFMSQISWRFESANDVKDGKFTHHQLSFLILFIVIKCLYTSLKEIFSDILYCNCWNSGNKTSHIHNNRERMYISPVFICRSLAPDARTYRKLLCVTGSLHSEQKKTACNRQTNVLGGTETSQKHSQYSMTCTHQWC